MQRFKKDLIVIIIVVLSVTAFFIVSDSVNSGFHLTDDHEVIRISKDLESADYFAVLNKWLVNDLNIRYRPMYFVNRVTEGKLFATDFTLWSLYNILLLIITLICFYAGMRRLKFSVFESLLFILLVFIGEQMAIWWRLGPNETIGMFFLSFTFLLIAPSKDDKKNFLNIFLFSISLILASLSKESFTVIIPAFLFAKIAYDKDYYSISWKESLLRNKLLSLPLFVMLINLYCIIYIVGTNKIGYAGVSDDGISEIINGVGLIIDFKLKWYLLMMTFLFLLIYFGAKKTNSFKFQALQLSIPFLFSMMILVPNLILYAKSGMYERYLLPAFVGLIFLLVSMLKQLRISSPKLSFSILIFLIIFGLAKVPETMNKAKEFTKEGYETNQFLNSVSDYYTDSQNILLVVDPVITSEWGASTIRYLDLEKNIKVGVYTIEDPSQWIGYEYMVERLIKNWNDNFAHIVFNGNIEANDQILFLNKDLAEKFFEKENGIINNYVNILDNNNRFAIYVK